MAMAAPRGQRHPVVFCVGNVDFSGLFPDRRSFHASDIYILSSVSRPLGLAALLMSTCGGTPSWQLTTSICSLGYCILIRGIFHWARISRIYAVYTADIRVLVPVRVIVLSLAVLYHMSASVVYCIM